MPDVRFHVVDLLAQPEALHQYSAIMVRHGTGLYVINDQGRFRRTPYNSATDAGALYRRCHRDPELHTVTGLDTDRPNQPHRVTVAFDELRAVSALVATGRNPGQPNGGKVGLRLLWGDKVHILDPGLAEQYADLANENVTAETILSQWADREGWPTPNEQLVRRLGTVAELRTPPRQGTKRATPEQLLKLPPIEIQLEEVMARLAELFGERAPARTDVINSWINRPGTANQQVQHWNERQEPAHLRAARVRAETPVVLLSPDFGLAQMPRLQAPATTPPPLPATSPSPPQTDLPAPAGEEAPQSAPSPRNGHRATIGGLFERAVAALSRRRRKRTS